MRIKYAIKFSFSITWLLYVQLLRGKNRYGLIWAVVINPPELPINDEAQKKHILQAQVCDFNSVIAQETKWGL